MKFLSYEQYVKNAEIDAQWKSFEKRWIYHNIAIEMARTIKLKKRSDVLEIGSFGNQIVPKSDTMDLTSGGWCIKGFKPTYDLDARNVPWPIADKKYKLLVALRVWHHLAPKQEEAFKESLRIAENVIICCPEKETVGIGIPKEKFYEWYGREARMTVTTNGWGIVYLF